MTTHGKACSVRELGGEIWAEFSYAFEDEDIHWKTREAAVDIAMAVLARHIGCVIVNDADRPVTPLPPPKNAQRASGSDA